MFRNAQKVIGRLSIMPNNGKVSRGSRNRRPRGARRSRPARRRRGVGTIPAQPRFLHLDFVIQSAQILTEAAAGVGADYAFRLNSLYDSNATGVGSQPVGYDQWSALFLRSVVYRGRFTLEFVNNGANPIQVGYYIKSGISPTVPSFNDWASQYGAKTALLATTGRNTARFNLSYSVAKWLGVSQSKIMDEEEYGESASGPAVAGNNQLLLYIWIRGFGGVAGSAALRLVQSMTAKMSEPNTLALS